MSQGKLKALAAARSILTIVWHLLAKPSRLNTDRKIRNLVHRLELLGHHIILQPTA